MLLLWKDRETGLFLSVFGYILCMGKEIAVERKHPHIRYANVFWLFLLGSVLGVLMEGIWTLIGDGHWESHVITIWGPFCIIYGFGFAGCYIGSILLEGKGNWTKFFTFAIGGAVVEFLCGFLILRYCGMRAWDYSDKFLNVLGLTDLNMSILWGCLGVGFGHLVPYIDKAFEKLTGRFWHKALVILSIFMAVNLLWTARVVSRWAYRHWNEPPANAISRMIDRKYTDEYLSNRYVEWWFLDEDGQYTRNRMVNES